jgi:hypothetical protein
MCLLTFFPAGVMPYMTALLNGAYLNDDGHGFAIVAGDQLIVQRGMDAESIIEAFDAARHQHPNGPALFHSRFSTHGQTGLDNCHPFPVGGDARTVLAHNGVLPRTVQPARRDPRSDTRIAAEDYLPAIGSLRMRRTRMRVERWMTPHNKMVILTVDRRFKERAYILNETSGTWDGGIWYSNDGYLAPTAGTRSRWDADPTWDWPPSERGADSLDRCKLCRAVINATEDACRDCGRCFDCGELPEYCYCYAPAALDTWLSPAAASWTVD